MRSAKKLHAKKKQMKLAAVTIAAVCALLIIMTTLIPPPLTAAGTVGMVGISIDVEALCQFPLVQDWNFMSVCANPNNKTVASIMHAATGKYDYILRWNPSSQAYDLYSIYSDDKPFTNMETNTSYFVHMNSEVSNFNITGTANPNMNISMVNEWNSPSWPYEFTTDVQKYINTIAGNWEYVLKWNSTLQSYDLYSIYSDDKPFTQIYMGEGQYIYVNATSAVLVYNRSALQ